MKLLSQMKNSKNAYSLMVSGSFAILLVSVCVSLGTIELMEMHRFMVSHLGYFGYVLLVPISVFVLAVFFFALIEELPKDSALVRASVRLETILPLIGLLSTFLAIGSGISRLGLAEINNQTIFNLAREIGTAVWSTIVAFSLSIIAGIIHKDLAVRVPKKQEKVKHVPNVKNSAVTHSASSHKVHSVIPKAGATSIK